MELKKVYQGMHDGANVIGENFQKVASAVFPIGYITLTITNENPSVYFGGTWERFAQGQMLVSINESDADFNEPLKTGGAKTQELAALIGNINESGERLGFKSVSPPTNADDYSTGAKFSGTAGVSKANNATKVVRQSDGQTPSNLPPYVAVYMWVRTE